MDYSFTVYLTFDPALPADPATPTLNGPRVLYDLEAAVAAASGLDRDGGIDPDGWEALYTGDDPASAAAVYAGHIRACAAALGLSLGSVQVNADPMED